MRQRKIKTLRICANIGLIIVILLIWYLLTKKEDACITFTKKDIVEYGDKKINAKDFVKETKEEIIVYPKVDTMHVGKQTLTYQVRKGSITKKIQHEITVEDTKKAIIKLKEEEIRISLGNEYNVALNIDSVIDPIDGTLSFFKTTKKNSYKISSNVDSSKEGVYSVDVTAIDKNGNKSNVSYKVRVVKEQVAEGSPKQIQPTYINGILIVNKNYGLPADFGSTDATAYTALRNLQKEAQDAGFEIPTLSGFRTYDDQIILYNDYVARDGKEAADRYSARPGFSEHQSGLCFDIGAIDDNYGETPAGKWLEENCDTYGFIIRYPNGKESITGYMYEPWHVRYVGEQVATKIMKSGMTLEEYLGVKR